MKNTRTLKHKLFISLFALFLQLGSFAQSFVDEAENLGVTAIVTSQEWGSGSSAFDFNRDGLDDITLCDDSGHLRLYENTGDGFEELDPTFVSLGNMKQFLWTDYNNDGEIDAMMSTLNGKFKVFRNNGNFTFEDVTSDSGLPNGSNFFSGFALADYDRDGDLDIYISIYELADSEPGNDIHENKLFENNGDGTFTNVTEESGVRELPTLSFQPVWLDINNDLYPDLFVINDRQPINFLFLNNGDGTFENITQQANVALPGMDCMSNSVTDFNGDGYLDIYITNSGNSNYPNYLFSNNGNGTFTDVAPDYGVQGFQFGWGASWIDANNNGWEDIFYCTTSGSVGNRFYTNNYGLSFNNESELLETEAIYPSYSVSKGDFDNDGYSDLVVQNRAPNPPYVMMNQNSGNDYVKITLEGTASNKDAIGSWIKVYHDNSQYSRYTLCGQDYYGQSSQHHIFGLGNSGEPLDSIAVTYPSGHTDVYYDLSVNSHYFFTEGETYTADILNQHDGAFCAGDSIVLFAANHENYLWSTGDTASSISVNSGGTFSLVVTNEFGVTATDTIEIVENPIPAVQEISTAISCFGDSTGTISLINQNNFEPDYVLWSNGMEGTEIDSLPAGTYSYFYQDINGCTATGSVDLNEPSELIIVANTIPETSGNDGAIILAIFGGTPPFSIEVQDNESESITITNLSSGTYEITVTDGNGCSKTVAITVESVVSSRAESKIAFNVYPNPAKDFLNIDSEWDVASVRIYDVAGKKIAINNTVVNGILNIAEIARGTYILEIENREGIKAFTRFTKN